MLQPNLPVGHLNLEAVAARENALTEF
jgi:hypothetical protein